MADADNLKSHERTVRREDGGKFGSKDLQDRRADSFMTPMPGAEPALKSSPSTAEETKCKLAFEEVTALGEAICMCEITLCPDPAC